MGLKLLTAEEHSKPLLVYKSTLKACAFRMLIHTSSRILLVKEIGRDRLDQGSHVSISLYLNIWRLSTTSAKISHCHLRTSNRNVPKTGLIHDSMEGPWTEVKAKSLWICRRREHSVKWSLTMLNRCKTTAQLLFLWTHTSLLFLPCITVTHATTLAVAVKEHRIIHFTLTTHLCCIEKRGKWDG